MPRDGPGQALSYISIAGLHPAVEFTRARTQVKVETMTSGQIESRRHARKDPPDARDRHFVPTRKIPSRVEITAYRPHAGPVLKQGFENTCTGEALAAVANYLLRRHRRAGAPGPVSSRMLYEMAKHYDEMRADLDHKGSTARAAMKGWHKHGVCAAAVWPYVVGATQHEPTPAQAADAIARPLHAYFRVPTHDLRLLRAAIHEIGVVYATTHVHTGWRTVDKTGRIIFPRPRYGAHAVALVGYDKDGFLLQNSRGRGWGKLGFGHIRYADWHANAMDAWVVELRDRGSRPRR